MDKKFGSSWHAVVGEGYGFELTHEVKNLLYMFFGGTVAVCVWKCSWNESKKKTTCKFSQTERSNDMTIAIMSDYFDIIIAIMAIWMEEQ